MFLRVKVWLLLCDLSVKLFPPPFHLDTLKQLESGMNSQATIYFFSSIFIGFLFAYLGMLVGKRTGRKLAEKA